MIVNTCGTCGKKVQFPSDRRGEKSKCPVCGDQFIIGTDTPEDDEDTFGLEGDPKPKKKPAPTAQTKPSVKLHQSDEEDDGPPDGKIECTTCHEFVPEDSVQCPYCADLIDRPPPDGKKRKKKK